jgi:hypothetical protein
MNQEFEAIVMGNYAELCIMWRIARVKSPGQAQGIDAKLKSLESVIDAFGMAMPELSELEASDAKPEPAEPEQQQQARAQTQSQPQPRSQDGPPSTAVHTGGVMLED